jgi:hypothetical protein
MLLNEGLRFLDCLLISSDCGDGQWLPCVGLTKARNV